MQMSKPLRLAAMALPLALFLTACANGDSNGGPQEPGGNNQPGVSDEGFAFGAPQSEVSPLLADLDPVVLTLQPISASPDVPTATAELFFMEEVEARSEGKITFDVAWAQSVASFFDVDDALLDGRLDLALAIPTYDVARYPIMDAYSTATFIGPLGPVAGMTALVMAASEATWADEDYLKEFTDKGLTPLVPMVSGGQTLLQCTEPYTSLAEWSGRQIRTGFASHVEMSHALGGSPITMTFPEAFEAAQRGTLTCNFLASNIAASSGFTGIAPYPHLLADGYLPPVGNSAFVAGASFKNLPLVYQQILFDAAQVSYQHGALNGGFIGVATGVEDSKANGGEVIMIDGDTAAALHAVQDQMVQDGIDSGYLPADIRETLTANGEKWAAIVAEAGIVDEGPIADLDVWLTDIVDVTAVTREFAETIASAHRPG